jgi:hypothetical protein
MKEIINEMMDNINNLKKEISNLNKNASEMFLQYSKDIIMSGECDNDLYRSHSISKESSPIQDFFICYNKIPREYEISMVDIENDELYVIEQIFRRGNSELFKHKMYDYVTTLFNNKNNKRVNINHSGKNYILFSNCKQYTNIFVLINSDLISKITS